MDIQDDISEDVIKRLIEKYKHKLEYDKTRYHTKMKINPDFREKNRAREHYKTNKDKKKDYYENNKETNQARNNYYYYKKTNRLELFKSKKKEQYEHLLARSLINPID